jgi:hypothetical protein
MTKKIDITVNVPLHEFVKVCQKMYRFAELMNNFDESMDNEDLAAYAQDAIQEHGDGLEVLDSVPLVVEFGDPYYGVD